MLGNALLGHFSAGNRPLVAGNCNDAYTKFPVEKVVLREVHKTDAY